MNGANEIEQVTVDEAIALSAGETVLVDVRERYEWDAGHAPNALLMPMSELEVMFEELPLDKTLLIICHSGSRSRTATRALTVAGYSAVNVVGGMSAWEQVGGPLVAEGPEPPRT
jgi:rhodanese-related sulfurtransferase